MCIYIRHISHGFMAVLQFLLLSEIEPTSFPGSLFSASLSRWNRDPGCGWSRDHLPIQNRRLGGYSSTFGREDDKIPHPSSIFFYHPDSGWSRDQPVTRVSVPTEFLVSKETVMLSRWERSKQKFGFIKRVDKGRITTVKD